MNINNEIEKWIKNSQATHIVYVFSTSALGSISDADSIDVQSGAPKTIPVMYHGNTAASIVPNIVNNHQNIRLIPGATTADVQRYYDLLANPFAVNTAGDFLRYNQFNPGVGQVVFTDLDNGNVGTSLAGLSRLITPITRGAYITGARAYQATQNKVIPNAANAVPFDTSLSSLRVTLSPLLFNDLEASFNGKLPQDLLDTFLEDVKAGGRVVKGGTDSEWATISFPLQKELFTRNFPTKELIIVNPGPWQTKTLKEFVETRRGALQQNKKDVGNATKKPIGYQFKNMLGLNNKFAEQDIEKWLK